MKNLRTGTAKFDTIRAKDANGLSIQDDGGNGLFIKDGGNVGIGTTNPSSKLEVFQDLNANDIGDSILTVTNTRLNTGSGSATIGFITDEVDGNTADKRAQISASYDGTNGGKLVLSTHNGTSLNQALTIKNDGNVGIGTTNPSALLHIAPKNNVDANGDPTNESYFKVYDNATSGLGQGRNGGVILIDANYYSQASTIFAVNGRGDNKFTIQGSGNVGIGTTNPGALLHLNGGAANNQAIFESTDGTSSILFKDPFGTAEFGNKGNSAVIMPAGVEKMRVTSDGNVGIGTTNPLWTFHPVNNVADDAISRFENISSSPYGIQIKYNSDPNSTSNWFLECVGGTTSRLSIKSNGGIYNVQANNSNLSDEREKKNIESADSTWNCLKNWEIKKFHYNQDADTVDKKYGVIAQQVEQHCPEVVSQWIMQEASEAVVDEEGHEIEPAKTEIVRKGLKEQQMYWMAINALKEAMSRIEDLETVIEDLKSRIETLEQ